MAESLLNPEIAIKTIDIGNDKKPDDGYINIKGQLKSDLEYILNEVKNGKRKPEEYDKFLKKAKELFEKHTGEVKKLEEKYEISRKQVLSMSERSSIYFKRKTEYINHKTKNILSEIKTDIEIGLSKGDIIMGFSNKKGNYTLKISDFEKELIKTDIKDINGMALKNYFIHLTRIGQLKGNIGDRNILIQKLGGGKIGEKKLLELSVYWNTKMINESHFWRDQKGNGSKKWKGFADLGSFTSGFRENKITDTVFKNEIEQKIKGNILKSNKRLLNTNENIQKTNESFILSRKHKTYEDIMKSMEIILGKNVTGEKIIDFLEGKSSELEKEIQLLNKEKKGLKFDIGTLKGKKFKDLFPKLGLKKENLHSHGLDENLIFDEKNTNHCNVLLGILNLGQNQQCSTPENSKFNIKDIKKGLELNAKINEKKEAKGIIDATRKNNIAVESTRQALKNGRPVKELIKIGGNAKKIEDTKKEIIEKKDSNSLIQNENDLNNEELINKEIERLQKLGDKKGIQKLIEYKKSKIEENIIYQQAKLNLTDGQLKNMIASGEIKTGFIDESKIPTYANFKGIDYKSLKTENFLQDSKGTISTKKLDEYFINTKENKVIYKGVEIKKGVNEGEYLIAGEKCKKGKEVKNILDTIEFFKNSGLGIFSQNIQKLNQSINLSNFKIKSQIVFNFKDGLSDDKKNTIILGLGKLIFGENSKKDKDEIIKSIKNMPISGENSLNNKLKYEKKIIENATNEIDYEKLQKSLV